MLQSRNIINFARKLSTKIILCGDFNLLPNTESLSLIERELNLQNLIKQFEVTSTRSSHYTKQEKFADYILVSKGIVVIDFKVLPEEVSDHAPLYIEIE